MEKRAKIVCLCGSTKFKDLFEETYRIETLNGSIVLSVGVFTHSGDITTNVQKIDLDQLHLQKIDMADEIVVVTEDRYIGNSTRREIQYAHRIGKSIR